MPDPSPTTKTPTSQTSGLTYDVVMATYNRPEAVALSIPLLLRQSRLPEQIIIVDSSADPAPIEAIARDADAKAPFPVIYQRAETGLTHQRNVGLKMCSADVVLYPDDDSLLYLDAMAEVMAVYEADTEGVIAGVATHGVDQAPPETEGDLGSYEAEKTSALRSALIGLRQWITEATGFTNPVITVGLKLAAQHRAPGWLKAREVVVVPYMTGFRMSFRRSVVSRHGFDETLRRYAWFEDIDASFAAMQDGIVTTARRARVYHHRVAANRASGRRMGLWAILNRSYIVMKHVRANPAVFPNPAREILRLKLNCSYRALAYRLLARDTFGRDRAQGAADALTMQERLIAAAPEELAEIYSSLDGSA